MKASRICSIVRQLLLPFVLLFQVLVWQVILVQLSHVQEATGATSPVDLLENKPETFYLFVAIGITLSNLLFYWWARRHAKFKRSPESPSQIPGSGKPANEAT